MRPNTPEVSPQPARAPLEGTVVQSRHCPVCHKKPLTGNQRTCSGKCRAAWSRQRRERERTDADRRIKWHARAILELLEEGK